MIFRIDGLHPNLFIISPGNRKYGINFIINPIFNLVYKLGILDKLLALL